MGGIRARLMGLVAGSVVPLVGLIGVMIWNQWQIDHDTALRRALNNARTLAAEIDDQLGNFQNLLIGASRAVSVDPRDVEKNDATLQWLKKDLPDYISNVLLFGADGFLIGTSHDGRVTRYFAGDRDFFQKVMGGAELAFGQPVKGRTTGQWVLSIARPVEGPNGEVAAVLLVGIKLLHFQRALDIRSFPPGTIVQLINEDGIVLTRNVDGDIWVGRNLKHEDRVARHLAAGDLSEQTRWADGVVRLTGSATAHLAKWQVSVGLPRNLALGPVQSRLGWALGLSVLMISAAFLLAWMLGERMTKPLRQLTADARLLAEGHFERRTSVRSNDEVGTLARTFNAMAESLEKRDREQEQSRQAARDEAVNRARLQEMERQAKEMLAAVIDTSPVAIVCSDVERRVTVWSRAAEQIFGYSAEEVMGGLSKIVPDGARDQSQALFERALRGESLRNIETRRRHENGALIDVEVSAAPLHHLDGSIRGVAWSYNDITAHKAAERKLKYVAHHDELTGLKNRAAMQRHVDALLASKSSFILTMFDLDGFKAVNDSAGHAAGDEVLRQVSGRLMRGIGDRGEVFRLGGDEFVAITRSMDPPVAEEMMSLLARGLAEPFNVDGQAYGVRASGGIASYPEDGGSLSELLRNADVALYAVKTDGGASVRRFSRADQQRSGRAA